MGLVRGGRLDAVHDGAEAPSLTEGLVLGARLSAINELAKMMKSSKLNSPTQFTSISTSLDSRSAAACSTSMSSGVYWARRVDTALDLFTRGGEARRGNRWFEVESGRRESLGVCFLLLVSNSG